jgi:hypothetical protein
MLPEPTEKKNRNKKYEMNIMSSLILDFFLFVKKTKLSHAISAAEITKQFSI